MEDLDILFWVVFICVECEDFSCDGLLYGVFVCFDFEDGWRVVWILLVEVENLFNWGLFLNCISDVVLSLVFVFCFWFWWIDIVFVVRIFGGGVVFVLVCIKFCFFLYLMMFLCKSFICFMCCWILNMIWLWYCLFLLYFFILVRNVLWFLIFCEILFKSSFCFFIEFFLGILCIGFVIGGLGLRLWLF